MKTSNEQHVTLHKEAQEVLEQAERKYWERAVIWFEEPRKLAPAHKYPYITLYHGDTVLHIETVPGYVTQAIFGVAEIHWNHPILNPRQVKQLIGLIKRDSVVQQDEPIAKRMTLEEFEASNLPSLSIEVEL